MKRTMLMMVGLGLLMAGHARGNNLIVNGGFETGDFSGWTPVPNPNGVLGMHIFSGTYLGFPVAHSGTYAVNFGNYYQHPDNLYQDVSTVAGQSYAIDFWLENMGGPQNSFVVSWDGNALLSLDNSASFAYTEFQFTVTASTATTRLEFSGTQTPAPYELDDVSVVSVPSPVPEPATFTMFGIGVVVGAVGYTRQLEWLSKSKRRAQ